MNQEKNKNKKKIVAISLFSALILGGVATTAYLMTKPSMNDQPQYLSSSESRNGSNVEFLDPSNESTDNNKENKKENKTSNSLSSSDDKKESTSQSLGSSERREGATPIDSSRIANAREEGANAIAPITQVRDIINRASANRANRTGSNSITAPDRSSREQEDEARRLAELEARRRPRTDNTNTIPSSPIVPLAPVLPTPPVIPFVPDLPTVTPVEPEEPVKPAEPEPTKPVEEKPTPSEPEKPAEDKPPTPPTPPTPTTPAVPAEDKPTVTKPVEEKPEAPKEEQNVVATIRTQEDLNSYLKKTGRDLTGDTVDFLLSEDVKFPKETYKILGKTVFNFPANPEGHTIDFDGSSFLVGTKSIFRFDATGNHGKDENDYLTIKNFVVYGSIEEDTNEDGSVNIKSLNKDIFEGDGRFSGRIAKASNMKFENATFNNAHGNGSHLFDVAGSDHIIFDKITAAGYGGKDLSEEEVEKRFKKDPHSVYSEAIQIDSFLPGAYGHINNLKNSILSNLEVDNKPSSHITINNSTFTSYVGFAGQDIADGNTAKPIVRNFGATVGSHTTGSDKYKNITITNNKFENTIGFKGEDGEKEWLSRIIFPIHLMGLPDDMVDTKIEGNTFNDKVFAKTGSGKTLHGIFGLTRVPVKAETPKEEKPTETKPVEDKPTAPTTEAPKAPVVTENANPKPVDKIDTDKANKTEDKR